MFLTGSKHKKNKTIEKNIKHKKSSRDNNSYNNDRVTNFLILNKCEISPHALTTDDKTGDKQTIPLTIYTQIQSHIWDITASVTIDIREIKEYEFHAHNNNAYVQ